MTTPKLKPAPAAPDRSTVVGELHEDAIPIFIHEPVLEQILEFSEQDVTRERGGFLLGGFHRDQGDYLEIRRFFPATDARSRAASLTFTHDTWSQLHREVECNCPDELVVGWHHTHPNFGVFLSAYDLFIHRNFFSEPWQVALVVDPQRHELRFFQWKNEDITDCGFICVRAAET